MVQTIPFHTIVGPLLQKAAALKRSKLSTKCFCQFYILRFVSNYVFLLGILGLGLSLLRIILITYSSLKLVDFCWKRILSSILKDHRVLQLTFYMLSLIYYSLLLVGIKSVNGIYFLPFLNIYGIIILLDAMVSILQIWLEGANITKSGLVMSMFLLVNFMSVVLTYICYNL